MDDQGTLGLEDLVLEKPVAPRNVSRVKKGRPKCPKKEVSLLSHLQKSSRQSDLPNEPSTALRVTAVPFAHTRISSEVLESTVQKPLVYPKTNLPLNESTFVQRGRWAGSPPANLGKAPSRPSRFSHSTNHRDLNVTLPATGKPSPPTNDSKDDQIHVLAPEPTSLYLNDAHAAPKVLPSPQKLLLVLDLNGTLLYRARASQNYTPRPHLHKFLRYAFANHSIFVWSSAQPYNVKGVCTRLFSKDQRRMLLGEWGRDTLDLTPAQYKQRVQVYKRLDRIWGNEDLQHMHPDFQGGKRWGQHNVILIDDSALKASAQPFNHVEVPEFVRGGGEKEGDGRDVLGQVVGYLEEARKWSNISGFVRHRPFKVDMGWHWAAEDETTKT